MENEAAAFLKISDRSKPRNEGLTSMHDAFLPLREVEDLLEVAADYIDYGKLVHIGLLQQSLPPMWLEKKIDLYHEKGVRVYPGGVPFQVAALQDQVQEYFQWVLAKGFDAVEIADDAMPVSIEERQWTDSIKMAVDMGLEVHTELGKKHPSRPLDLDEACTTAQRDLSLGVSKVVIERAELDTFMHSNDVSPLLMFIKTVGLQHLLFEPGPFGWPDVHRWCFQTFGKNVNLGNIEKDEVIYIEYSRRGISRFVDYDYFNEDEK